MQLDLIAGARPNFMKIAPLINELTKHKVNKNNINYRLVHTGQHYDKNMSQNFFDQLGIPPPDINLKSGSGTQAEQTAKIMKGYEKLLFDSKPDITIVVGDVNSTMACAIVAKKMNVKVAHIEAGIRSNDWSMPEEINRIVTDSITDYFFTTSESASQNLRNSGVKEDKIFFVGNTMIDTLIKFRPNFTKPKIWDKKSLLNKEYIILTLHRPSSVDNEKKLGKIINQIVINSNSIPIIFPAHPRTQKKLELINTSFDNLHIVNPLSYLEFNFLVERSKAVITDSGGITEETTIMNIPCITLRDNTERPETVEVGTNELIGSDPKLIPISLEKLFEGKWKNGSPPLLWDGKSAQRIVKHLFKICNN